MKKNRFLFVIDLALVALFLAELEMQLTGLPLHEWFGITMGPILLVHAVVHWDWITGITKRLASHLPIRSKMTYLLNWLLFVAFVLVVGSGILISKVALPQLGIELGNSTIWRSVHTAFTQFLLIITALHIAVHWQWILDVSKRFFTFNRRLEKAHNKEVLQ